jgi:hypothetical protein
MEGDKRVIRSSYETATGSERREKAPSQEAGLRTAGPTDQRSRPGRPCAVCATVAPILSHPGLNHIVIVIAPSIPRSEAHGPRPAHPDGRFERPRGRSRCAAPPGHRACVRRLVGPLSRDRGQRRQFLRRLQLSRHHGRWPPRPGVQDRRRHRTVRSRPQRHHRRRRPVRRLQLADRPLAVRDRGRCRGREPEAAGAPAHPRLRRRR